MDVATSLKLGLPPLVAGLVLGWAGWVGGGQLQAPPLDYSPQLLVRPSDAGVVTTRGASPKADPSQPGRYSFETGDFSLELRPEGWPVSKVEVEEPRGMTTVRATIPRATLAIIVKGDKDAEARLTALPNKEKLKVAQGQTRLDPGAHELMVEADGYLPKRLSVNLAPAERKEVTLAMEALPSLPGFPDMGSLPSSGPRPALPSDLLPRLPSNLPSGSPVPSPPPYRPPAETYAPRPAYRPPAPRPAAPAVSHPVPVPRFTPIAPPPQLPANDPVPMFTPIRH